MYKSGLERNNAAWLKLSGCTFEYETFKLPYVVEHTYTPDFLLLPNCVIVETKGRFIPKDRSKHLYIREQHPDLDIRFVFSNSKSSLYKGSRSTYADWCYKHGFLYADKRIPRAWLKEPINSKCQEALAQLKQKG